METGTTPPRSLQWPALIIAFLLLEVGLCVTGYLLAQGDRSFAVESDYYKKGQDWDRKAEEMAASQKLGWQASISVAPFPNAKGNRLVSLTLLDAQGKTVEGASVKMRCFPHARPMEVQESEMLPAGEGKYTTELPVFRPGLWEFRVMAKRYSDVFAATIQKELPDMETGVAAK